MKYLSTTINFVFGAILYYGPIMEGPAMYFCMISTSVFALLSIFLYGMFAYGWSALFTDPKSFEAFVPGTERTLRIYRSTMSIVNSYNTRLSFWLSVAASVFLMLGLMNQDWKVVLALEIVASALGYNFIHWASQRIPQMYMRAYGTEMKS